MEIVTLVHVVSEILHEVVQTLARLRNTIHAILWLDRIPKAVGDGTGPHDFINTHEVLRAITRSLASITAKTLAIAVVLEHIPSLSEIAILCVLPLDDIQGVGSTIAAHALSAICK